MNKSKLIKIIVSEMLILSTLMTGCKSVKETTDTTTSVIADTSAEETESVDSEWEQAKVSGNENDYEKYFKIDESKFSTKAEKRGEMTEISYYSTVVGANRQAFVYTPADYDSSKTYPVMYLIHGIGCDGGQWVSMDAAGYFDRMIESGDVKPFVAVFPSVIPSDGINKDTLSKENVQAFTDFVKEFKDDLAPYIKSEYSISDNREDTAICGLSMGGMEALRLGFTYQDVFGYIGSFSAAPTLELNLLKITNPENTPFVVLLCSGDSDNTVGDNPKKYHEELTANGVDHIWYQHPGGGHSPNVWKTGLVNFVKECNKADGGF